MKKKGHGLKSVNYTNVYFSVFLKMLSVWCKDSHWVVVANKDQVLVLTTPYCACVQWVNNAHVRLLLEAQQTGLMELHTVTAIRADADHCPYYQCDLNDGKVNTDFERS